MAAESITLTESFKRRVKFSIKETLSITENHIHIIIGHGMRHVREIIPTMKEIPNIRYIIKIKETLSLREKVGSDQSGPSYRWKFVPWKKPKTDDDTSNKQ